MAPSVKRLPYKHEPPSLIPRTVKKPGVVACLETGRSWDSQLSLFGDIQVCKRPCHTEDGNIWGGTVPAGSFPLIQP